MAPTIKPGGRVTNDYLAYAVASPRRWDVVGIQGTSTFLPTNATLNK
jgi:hypothetical protein